MYGIARYGNPKKYSHLHDWGSSEVGECGRLDADTMVLLVDLEILLLDEVAALGALQLGLPGLGGLLQGAVVRRQILNHLHIDPVFLVNLHIIGIRYLTKIASTSYFSTQVALVHIHKVVILLLVSPQVDESHSTYVTLFLLL